MKDSPYFESREEIGKKIAEEIAELNLENTAVLAVSPGGVMIAIEIAKKLHSITGLLLLKRVNLPGQLPYGMLNDHGNFTYDGNITIAQAEDFKSEYRGSIEEEKREALHQLHIIGHEKTIEAHHFNGRNLIIVNDISRTGTSFQAALDFLKPAKLKSVILVAAVAQVESVDVMHRLGDKIFVTHTTDKNFPAEHYFTNNEIPQSKAMVKMLEQSLLQW
jgi:putative phosphoribosyl transferase